MAYFNDTKGLSSQILETGSLKPETFITTQADQCVKCGLCLPHCPTYVQTRDEGNSPRGRIALMQGVASGQLAVSTQLNRHLDSCLGCRACEKICPSGVRYGELLDTARAFIEPQRQRPARAAWLRRAGLKIIEQPRRLARLYRLLRLGQRCGLVALARLIPFGKESALHQGLGLLPELQPAKKLARVYPAQAVTAHGDVALFQGCMERYFGQDTLTAAIQVLTRLGYNVHVPAGQACCGALHQHNGETHTAEQMARQNAAAFNQLDIEAVLYISSGCGAMLHEYDSRILQTPVMDINKFVNQLDWPRNLSLKPLPQSIILHTPCSQRFITGSDHDTLHLLQRIPELDIHLLPGQARCCGAAGSYMLSEADMAGRLLRDTLRDIQAAAAATVVTSNIGCALQLAAGSKQAGLDIDIMHPVTLLAQQIEQKRKVER